MLRLVLKRVRQILWLSSPALNVRPGVLGDRYPVLNVAGVTMTPLIKNSLKRDYNPYDLTHREYFDKRRVEIRLRINSQAIHSKLLKKQKGICPICNGIID